MSCKRPIFAWRSKEGRNSNGKWPLSFKPQGGYSDMRVVIPCGKCIGCRLDYTLSWSLRLMQELSFYKDAIFATFTYEKEPNGLIYSDFQKFFKRLRKYVSRETNCSAPDIKYYVCGEYGDRLGRPHFHAIIYGLWPSDGIVWNRNDQGDWMYVSPQLEKLWSHGFVKYGRVSFNSCSYVAGYIRKKLYGERAAEYVDVETGELRKPPFAYGSKGIGKRWIEKYWSDVIRLGYMRYLGKVAPLPRYYEKYLEQNHPDSLLTYYRKRSKIILGKKDSPDYHPDRLAAAEEAILYRISRLQHRKLDESDGL